MSKPVKPGDRCKHDQPIFGECSECENEFELALDLEKGKTINKLREQLAAMTARAEAAEADARVLAAMFNELIKDIVRRGGSVTYTDASGALARWSKP